MDVLYVSTQEIRQITSVYVFTTLCEIIYIEKVTLYQVGYNLGQSWFVHYHTTHLYLWPQESIYSFSISNGIEKTGNQTGFHGGKISK